MYHLQKYAGRRTRHKCPSCGRERCFALYVDEKGNILDESVGRCDHANSCGYHLKPREFYAEHPGAEAKEHWKPIQKPLCTIDPKQIDRFRSNRSNLIDFLLKVFPLDKVEQACDAYFIGALASGETIFWQIDQECRPRSAKLMKYGTDGHRIKEDGAEVGWLHSRLKKDGFIPQDWELTQCLFGEHLLKTDESKIVCIVESEKTALICSIEYPQCLWLATGGKNNINGDRFGCLYGRRVIVYPDADAYDEWADKVSRMADLMDIGCWETAEGTNPYTQEDIEHKRDIADLILQRYDGTTSRETHCNS